MTIYEKVKSAVTVKQAAERYGLESDSRGMALCPFHDDHHPSMKLNEEYFFCFGCGAHGDVVALTAGLFGIPPGEAAKKLAEDFGISSDYRPSVLKQIQTNRNELEEERYCFRVLSDYLQILLEWKKRYAPQTEAEEPNPRFTDACMMTERVSYFLDQLIECDRETRADLVQDMKGEGYLERIAKKVEEYREENEDQ